MVNQELIQLFSTEQEQINNHELQSNNYLNIQQQNRNTGTKLDIH
jgi:hypothetical protein